MVALWRGPRPLDPLRGLLVQSELSSENGSRCIAERVRVSAKGTMENYHLPETRTQSGLQLGILNFSLRFRKHMSVRGAAKTRVPCKHTHFYLSPN